MTILRQWTGNHGRIVLTLHAGGLLVKSEKSCDRLHVTGDRGHGIDVSMIAEAIEAGAKTLEIREDAETLVWRAEIAPLLAKSRVMTLAGVKRWALYLEHFDLVKGDAPDWYAEAKARKQYAERRDSENVQLPLFDTSAFRRLGYEQ